MSGSAGRPVRLVWSGRWQRRRLSWLVLMAATAVGVAVAVSASTIALRTDSAFERIRADVGSVDAVSAHFHWPGDVDAAVGAIDDPQLVDWRHWVGYAVVEGPAIPANWRYDVFGSWDDGYGLDERLILDAGRAPAAADEVVIDAETAELGGLDVGDVVTMSLLRGDHSGVDTFEFEVVGVGTTPLMAVVDDSSAGGLILVDREFVNRHPELLIWSATGLVLDTDDERAAASRIVGELGWELSLVADDEVERVRAALRPTVASLLMIATISLLSTLVVVVLAIRREHELWDTDEQTLGMLGLPSAAARRLRLATAAGVLAPGWLLGAVLGSIPTALAPIGALARFEPGWDITIDARVHAIVGASVLLAVVGATTGSQSTAAGSRTGRRLPRHGGLLLAVAGWLVGEAVTGSRRRVVAAGALGATALAAATAAMVFVGSLDRLVERPPLYGDTADVVGRNAFGDQLPEALNDLADDPAVDALATLTMANVIVDGVGLPSFAVDVLEGDLSLALVEGRLPEGDDEIVVGIRTGDALDVGLGDQLRLGSAGVSDERRVEVVGSAVFPALASPGIETPRLGSGVAFSTGLHRQLFGPDDLPEFALIDLADGVDAATWVAARGPEGIEDALASSSTDWVLQRRPAEVSESASIRNAVMVGAIAIAAVVACLLALSAAAVLRRQRSCFAVLHALGAPAPLRRRAALLEVFGIVATIVAIGGPVGLAAGRLAWVRFAEWIGVVPDPVGLDGRLALLFVAIPGVAVVGTGFGLRSTLGAPTEARR